MWWCSSSTGVGVGVVVADVVIVCKHLNLCLIIDGLIYNTRRLLLQLLQFQVTKHNMSVALIIIVVFITTPPSSTLPRGLALRKSARLAAVAAARQQHELYQHQCHTADEYSCHEQQDRKIYR